MKHLTVKFAATVLTLCIGLTVVFWFSRPTSPKRCNDDLYFPTGAFSQRTSRMVLLSNFYSAMMESPLPCLEKNIEAYRVLFLPSFGSPASVRIWRERNQKYIEVKQLSSPGVPQYGAKDLKVNISHTITDEEWDHFQGLLKKADFWALPTEAAESVGIDGASYLLEGYKSNQHHVVDRWSLEDENFVKTCGYLLEISGLERPK